MYARVTNIHIKTDKVQEAISLYENSVLPAAESQAGFQGALLLTDAPTGHGLTITFWNSKNEALANEQNLYYQNQLVKFMPYFTDPPTREGFEVSLFRKP
ncbi:MAG: antibiotic biosynthesis monooxygenase [Candidatus Aminicenantes bacterium]|nr:antibiotic biosynthesis monooxygenase [Candidatus Aminicenantes bacterium]